MNEMGQPSAFTADEERMRFKVVIVGEPRVGKTTAVSRYVERQTRPEYKQTIGSNLYVKDTMLSDIPIKLLIFDIAGQTPYESVRSALFHNVDGVVAMFDMTNPHTLNLIDNWLQEVATYNPDAVCVVVGNKSDLADKIKVTVEDIQLSKLPLTVDETFTASALTGSNMLEMWHTFCTSLVVKRRNA